MIKKSFLTIFLFFILSNKVLAGDILYYSATDGTVRGVNIATGIEATSISSANFKGAIVGASREIAIDPVTRLLWYTATDNSIYSFHTTTLAEGPSIPSNRITGAIVGGARHLYIDYSRRHLLVTTTSGAIQRFRLDTLADIEAIPASFFTDGNVGILRHLASDVRTGNIWYAATDGSFREFNPDSLTHTGRRISFGEQYGANPGGARHFVIDPSRDLLLYAVTDGSIATIPLTSLTKGSIILKQDSFIGANPGAGRIISTDIDGTSGGNAGYASFASNYLILPFVSVVTDMLSATLRFDADKNMFVVDHYEPTSQTAINITTFDLATGLLTIPYVNFQGTTYRAILIQIPGTLNFSLKSAEIQ